MTAGDRVRVQVFVRVDALAAFEVFTRETDLWWRRGPAYRFAGARRGVLRFEPGPGGRLFEQFDDGSEYEVGRVSVWEPGARLQFEWRIPNFAPGERTEVELQFEPGDGGTRVTLEHRGWASLPKDYPARHGLDVPEFIAQRGMWWGGLLSAFRYHADAARAG